MNTPSTHTVAGLDNALALAAAMVTPAAPVLGDEEAARLYVHRMAAKAADLPAITEVVRRLKDDSTRRAELITDWQQDLRGSGTEWSYDLELAYRLFMSLTFRLMDGELRFGGYTLTAPFSAVPVFGLLRQIPDYTNELFVRGSGHETPAQLRADGSDDSHVSKFRLPNALAPYFSARLLRKVPALVTLNAYKSNRGPKAHSD